MAQVREGIIPTQRYHTYGNPVSSTPQANLSEQLPQGPTFLQPAHQETLWSPDASAQDKLISRDRHAAVNRGTERTGRRSGLDDPLLSGPPRPSLRTINRTINHQRGQDAANADDKNRAYNRDRQGTLLGQQDGTVQPVYGGTPGFWQPYGSYSGYTTGPTKGLQSPVAPGSPQDGPRKINSGPSHGLHSATFPDYSQALGRYMAIPSMVAQRQDRPSNSRIAGQSYSQTVAPQGQQG